jgi:hypothetical protein
MLGQIAPCGTGDTDILIDESKLIKNMQTIVNLEEVPLDDDLREDACAPSNFAFEFTVPSVGEARKGRATNKLMVK